MGGCCSSPKKDDKDRTPVYYYCPRTLEDREPVPFTNVTSSAISPEPYFDRNLDSSVPDACQAPPAPVPNDVALACSNTLPEKCSNTLPEKLGNCGSRIDHIQPVDSPSVGLAKTVDEKLNSSSECKIKVIGEQDSNKVVEDEPSKLNVPDDSAREEEDVCPTCLEEYDLENPRIITKCEHHFHLSCIFEWMERSNTCPICDQIMIFDMGNE